VAEPTDADRTRAVAVVAASGPATGPAATFRERRLLEGMAQALADERERARAPFLALADEAERLYRAVRPEAIRTAALEDPK
jgi:hypothetical protein